MVCIVKPEVVSLLTFGHGTADEETLAALIRGAEIETVIDVRTVPKSRIHPHVWAERMSLWIPARTGATYEWRRELGGFRKASPQSPNVALRHAGFRGYADYMQSGAFLAALDALLETASQRRTAVMCSESLWWRCHRRLIADAATLLRGANVHHLMHDGALQAHKATGCARVLAAGLLQYDVSQS